MSKKSGVVLLLFGILLAIGALFFDFYDTGTMSFRGWDSLTWFFQNLVPYFDVVGQIGTVFQADFTTGLLILFPLVFLPAILFLLIGLKVRFFAFLGWVFLLVHPLEYLIKDVILATINGSPFGTVFGYLGIGFYLQFGATLILIIGILLHKKE
ncbi:MAG: hypothetical protein E4G98_01150 [Promethearchaeota archaeon]|nr:MAG: hypothetical protein E4G98_01150 [Candidatus Lokiarchaeota archaeon]